MTKRQNNRRIIFPTRENKASGQRISYCETPGLAGEENASGVKKINRPALTQALQKK
jgi:hypothetical protein